jgi:hypothetical protein
LTGGKGIDEPLEAGDYFCTATAAAVQSLPMHREQFLLAIPEFPMFAHESLQGLDEHLRHLKVDRPRNEGLSRQSARTGCPAVAGQSPG